MFPRSIKASIDYELSDDQKRLSRQVNENFLSGIDTLIHAVCGAGKTELVFEVIATVLSQGKRVGFAIPRRDVVRELHHRLMEAFPDVSVIGVYGGHHSRIDGDLVVLTTHQLFRYENYFDLLIVDEIDAFPFKNNDLLQAFFRRSIKERYVLLSATPSEKTKQFFASKNRSLIELFTRYHGGLLPEPQIVVRPLFLKLFFLIEILKVFVKQGKPCFVFTATIEQCEDLFFFLRLLIPKLNRVHSRIKDRASIIDNFKKGIFQFLITTSVLERGVTIKNLQVVIYGSDHRLYDQATLVQIAGRVGRKSDAKDGKVIFLGDRVSESMSGAVEEIRFANLHV